MNRATRPLRLYAALRALPQSLALEAALGVPRAWTHVYDLHLYDAEHGLKGDLSRLAPEAVAAAAHWTGNATLFVVELRRAGFLTERGRLVEMRPMSGVAIRVRRHRARRCNALGVTSVTTAPDCLVCPQKVNDFPRHHFAICEKCRDGTPEIHFDDLTDAILDAIRAKSRVRRGALLALMPWLGAAALDKLLASLFGRKLIRSVQPGVYQATPPPKIGRPRAPILSAPRMNARRGS